MSVGRVVKRVRLGDEVLTFCGKCKEERTHQVVAFGAGGEIERVTCLTCQGNHLYRDGQKAKKAGARSGDQSRVKPAARPAGPVHDYSPKVTYSIGQLISHPKLGTGEVIDVRGGKIDVRFGKDMRTLLHAG